MNDRLIGVLQTEYVFIIQNFKGQYCAALAISPIVNATKIERLLFSLVFSANTVSPKWQERVTIRLIFYIGKRLLLYTIRYT